MASRRRVIWFTWQYTCGLSTGFWGGDSTQCSVIHRLPSYHFHSTIGCLLGILRLLCLSWMQQIHRLRKWEKSSISYHCSFVPSFVRPFVRFSHRIIYLLAGAVTAKNLIKSFVLPLLSPSLVPPHLPQRFIFWRFFRCRRRRKSPISRSRASLGLSCCLSCSIRFKGFGLNMHSRFYS